MTTRETMLDTNVVSEVMRAGGSPSVVQFVAGLPTPFLSVAVFHELSYGVEMLPSGARKARFKIQMEALRRQFETCIVEVDEVIARVSGELRARARRQGGELKPMDALIAASALTRSARLATRNIKHFENLGIEVVDPWLP